MIKVTVTHDWSLKVESDSPTFKGWKQDFTDHDNNRHIRCHNYIDGLRHIAEALGQEIEIFYP